MNGAEGATMLTKFIELTPDLCIDGSSHGYLNEWQNLHAYIIVWSILVILADLGHGKENKCRCDKQCVEGEQDNH